MSFWRRLLERLQAIQLDLENWLRSVDPISTVDFSIAFIALSAKLAKADGRVSRSEVVMFRRIMEIPPEEEENAARVYNLCCEEAAGYQHYARRIRRLIQEHQNEEEIRTNLIDGLFHIALADGEYHPEEDCFLREVADILGVSEHVFNQLRARHVPDAWCPYNVLGVAQGSPPDNVRDAWRCLVRQNHPDLLISKGLPQEMIQIAESRLKDINRAYEELTHA
jgi:DnaJ like chaperone protein